MATRDFYQVLGVARDASADEIKRAYRALARKHHPDVNKSPDAAKTFAQVQNAYDALSDEKKRALYDQFGESGLSAGFAHGPSPFAHERSPGPGGRRVHVGQMDFDPEDLSSMFETFFGASAGGTPRSAHASPPGSAGRKGRASRRPHAGSAQPAEPMRAEIKVDFVIAALGGKQSVRVRSEAGERTMDVSIPAGLPEGANLRLRTQEGDLLLMVRLGEHPIFRRGEGALTGRSLDLFIDVPLTVAEATFGTTLNLPLLDGTKVELRIPPGTASGRKLRLRSHGIKAASGQQGDLFAVAQVVPPAPADLCESERDVIQRMSERQGNPRLAPGWR